MNLENMNIGGMIKYHRRLKRMTQGELCKGICSVTHLSKFENYNKEVNEETVLLLLERLDISIDSIQKASKDIGKELSNLLDAIVSFDKERATESYKRLKGWEEYITFSNYISLYHLYIYRYHLLMLDFEKASKEQELIKQILNSFTQQEKEMYEYFNSILHNSK
ncbi:MAG TPA: helix-turn-helix transcriptional regulator, partial [Bacillaceae bacterium]